RIGALLAERLNTTVNCTLVALYEYVWDDSYLGEDKTINVHICNIRKKLKAVTQTEYIDTVWGIGFKLSQ
ncbi:MAG: winged helix-turn-helix domain-containing protein, partial [Lachnospiraceae bacterium]|nr:winged helix-turn-helix domain-containing protein [Lachnospiraceae bacterium]